MKTQSKKAFYDSAISERKNNPKQLWEFMDSVIHTKRSTTCPSHRVNVDSSKTEDPGENLETFKDYFVKIGESIARKTKTMKDNVDFTTFLNNSVSQSIVSNQWSSG